LAPPALHQLAAHQVERLDVVGALVDREDLRVAAVLLDRPVLEVTGAAVDLDGGGAHLERLVGAVGLHQRHQQIDLALVVVDLGLLAARLLERVHAIEVHRQLHRQRADALDPRLAVEQHAADVGVIDDGHARRGGVLPLLDARALLAVLGVVERVEERRRRHRDALQADADAGEVHQVEHLAHAALLLGADQLADAAVVVAEVHHAGGRWP
jgi:hypothetical protein